MERHIRRGLAFLADEQYSDGSFVSYSSLRPDQFNHGRAYPVVFPSALIAASLSIIPETETIRQRLADFLLTQRSDYWSFNYWKRGSDIAQTKPYPDDLDDTFCALAALTLYDPKLIDAAVLAHVVSLLTATEVQEGGPYKTWLVLADADQQWKDVDLAVNSNVAYFLHLHEIDLPNVTSLIEAAISAQQYTSRYYPDMYPILYFIARWYHGPKRALLQEYILSHRHSDSSWGNPLHTALAASALLNLGISPESVSQSVSYLIETQQSDGSWPAQAFCLDPSLQGKTYYAGSEALTTALCLEAVQQYAQAATSHTALSKLPESQSQYTARVIEQNIRTRFSQLEEPIRLPAEELLTRVMTRNQDQQIALLPYHMSRALASPPSNSDELAVVLGQMNVYGWMAYTIYDDFLDGSGDSRLLSVANVCLRELITVSHTISTTVSTLPAFLQTILDTIDSANAWEVARSRLTAEQMTTFNLHSLPQYGNLSQLAHKSFGHALGPAAFLLASGYTEESVELQQLLTSFRHYLIARQMNDDAHDWKEDLSRGHINSVAAALIRDYAKGRLLTSLSDPTTIERLEQFLWEHTIIKICSRVIDHIHEARRLFTQLPMISNPHVVTQFFDSVEKTAQRTLEEREQTLQFIQTYSRVQQRA